MATQIFDNIRAVRTKIAAQLDGFTTEQLNKIPEGLNNNLVWQLGHLVVATEMLCYWRSGAMKERAVPLADNYRNGSKPEAFVPETEIAILKERFFSSIDTLEAFYTEGALTVAEPFALGTFGIPANNMDELLQMCLWHDTLHWGNINVIRKLV